jgi:hypothetical protein
VAKTEPNTIPDALGEGGKTTLLVEQFGELQGKIFRLDMLQKMNDQPDDAPIPGHPADEEGKVPTYGQQRSVLKKAQRRLADANEKLMPSVRQYLRDQLDG